ncbi:MAG: acetyl-CoA carboxylase biotin carboxylase subunit, partial [Clostridia bacterium]|nr:acetyl-CoA carboxylase biotin carboxylase subunit [Clostridia bacterium]
MIKRILVANRGEIAMRIIRAARQLGIETVLVHSSEDADSKPVSAATKAVCVGGPAATKSYLNQESIIQTALSFGCDAIHPGYGFLSENADFAEKCKENGIVFIGPTAEVITLMGDKQTARKRMKSQGVPTVPGSDGLVPSAEEAKKIADKVGYPVLLKATAGGGGRGMRIAKNEDELVNAFDSATAEAANAFGNGNLYLEKLILTPRHIEVQILGDNYGNVIHLGERDCSLQRRNQKMIEEAPAYGIDEETRREIREAALKAAKSVGYTSAGTVEFVVDKNGCFYFIEMNTRIQVEHPVTEMLTGVDIVREQLLIASGEPLSIRQEDIVLSGAAIECRINAEDAAKGFLPCPGTISQLQLPCGEGVRLETALYSGARISPYYDSMIAKLIVHAQNRTEAIRKMYTALEEMK